MRIMYIMLNGHSERSLAFEGWGLPHADHAYPHYALSLFYELMDAPLCRLCGHKHYGMAHVFATNIDKASASNIESASNGASNDVASNTKAEKKDDPSVDKDAGYAPTRPAAGGQGVNQEEPVEAIRKQRWSREAYNAYQRDYMRRRREKRKIQST